MSRTLNIALAREPNAYAINLTPEALSGIDLSAVTSASFAVREPGGTELEWTAVITNQTTTTITLTHMFVEGVSAPVAGVYVVLPLLVIPSGVVGPEHPNEVIITAKFEV